MNSSTTSDFRAAFRQLPPAVQQLARKNFRLWFSNPYYPSLHFKKVGEYWSVRVGDHYRAVGRMKGDTMYWFWIGTHGEYDKLF